MTCDEDPTWFTLMAWYTEDDFRGAVRELHRRAEQKVPSAAALAPRIECIRSWERSAREFYNQFRARQRLARVFDAHADGCTSRDPSTHGWPCNCFRSWGFPFEEIGDASTAGAYPIAS